MTIDQILNELLEAGYKITIFQNALGTITGVAHSISEITIEKEDEESWKPTKTERHILGGEIIVDGETVIKVLLELLQKKR